MRKSQNTSRNSKNGRVASIQLLLLNRGALKKRQDGNASGTNQTLDKVVSCSFRPGRREGEKKGKISENSGMRRTRRGKRGRREGEKMVSPTKGGDHKRYRRSV